MSDIPQIHSVYDKEKLKQAAEMKAAKSKQTKPKVVDMNKSYESLGSNEEESPHYNYDSDGEPPTDQVGDKLTIIKRQQVTKTILEVGANDVGKPGKPYIVTVSLLGYFAAETIQDYAQDPSEPQPIKTKDVSETHIRLPADQVGERGEVFVDHWDKPIKITLGDDRLPIGLWKSMEHMRRGEKARIMIKPAWGYNCEKNRDVVFFPRGWDTVERKEMLKKRRVFFDVILHDWIVRHDILGNGLLVKALNSRGRGFDRPSQWDEIKMNLKIYQRENVFCDKQNFSTTIDALPLTL